MFMNTSLAHYQLPLFGLNSMALSTEIGASQRSIFLQPITAAGETPTESWPITVEVQQSDKVSQEYRNWLARVTDYQEATGSAGAEAPHDQSTDASSSAADNGTDAAEPAGDDTSPPPQDDASPAAPPSDAGNGGSSSANSGNNAGSSSGGVLGFLFG